MKKIVLFATAVLLLMANVAMADSIAGNADVTTWGGTSYILKSEFTDAFITVNPLMYQDIKPYIEWTVGNGIMYGITYNLPVNSDVIYLQTYLKTFRPTSDQTIIEALRTAKTTDFPLGAQWRFIPKSRFVPYIGDGLNVLRNDIDASNAYKVSIASAKTDFSIATTYGNHLSVGSDFFITPNIALNAEVRGLYSAKGDITYKETAVADYIRTIYNPSNISGFLGMRFFFGGAKEASQPIAKEEEIKKAPEAAVVEPVIEKGRITLNVEFDTGKSIVKPAYYKEIERVADIMKKKSELNIVIEGHTDNLGGKKYNLNLSQKRTEAIKMVLVKKFKIEATRITPKGFGYSKPIADNSTKEGRKSNRRVEASLEYTINK